MNKFSSVFPSLRKILFVINHLRSDNRSSLTFRCRVLYSLLICNRLVSSAKWYVVEYLTHLLNWELPVHQLSNEWSTLYDLQKTLKLLRLWQPSYVKVVSFSSAKSNRIANRIAKWVFLLPLALSAKIACLTDYYFTMEVSIQVWWTLRIIGRIILLMKKEKTRMF